MSLRYLADNFYILRLTKKIKVNASPCVANDSVDAPVDGVCHCR